MCFDPHAYGPTIARLLEPLRVSALGPGEPNRAVLKQLESLTLDANFCGRKIVNHGMARACLAGLWLYHDFLDRSHTISQAIDTSTGSFWHGIMHRREEDFSNAKYWFKRVGKHEIFPELAEAARELATSAEYAGATAKTFRGMTQWDPFAFVDRCAAELGSSSPGEELCRQIQIKEWQLLFEYCYRHGFETAGVPLAKRPAVSEPGILH
jgi:hypothetical protein